MTAGVQVKPTEALTRRTPRKFAISNFLILAVVLLALILVQEGVGTLDFGTEITRSVSGTMQFHTTGRPASPLTDVFYAGCPDDDFEVCLAGIRDLGLPVSRLPECPAFRALPNGERLSDWLGCAEALIR